MLVRPGVIAIAAALALGGCGGDDSGGAAKGSSDSSSASSTSSTSSASTSTASDTSADDVLHDAVQASLDASSFDVDATSQLTIGDDETTAGSTDLQLVISGSVDYENSIADTTLQVDQDGSTSTAQLLSDGTTLWVSVEGSQAPEFPDNKTWIAGDASRLNQSSTFGPDAAIGPAIVLSGADGAQQVDTGEKDGVDATEYTFTVAYDDAVAAAGANADAFTSAFKLTGDASSADLDIDAWIGDDDAIVRQLSITVDTDVPVTGGVELSLTGVNQPVDAPEPPDSTDVSTGPEADALLDQLITS